VLVTGASRGIGAAVALALGRAGMHPIMVARTQAGLEEIDDAIGAAGGSATLLPLDITDYEQIDRMAYAIAQRFGRLDGMALVAGMLGGLSPVGHLSPKTVEQVFALNVMANWRILRACDALLRVSPAPRVAVATDRTRSPFEAYWGVYAASKAALTTLAMTYAAETVETPIRVNLVDPGPVATALRNQGFPGEDKALLPQPADIAPLFVDLLRPEERRHGEIVGRPLP
jgi:NAD(P)-dependent dehydrogenase (short-subunit alcohol dehydrogenase family)